MVKSESETYQVGTIRRLRHPRPHVSWSLQICPEPMDPALWVAASAALVSFVRDPVANAISHPFESWFDPSFRRHPSSEVWHATCLKVDNQSRTCLSIRSSFDRRGDYRRNWGAVWTVVGSFFHTLWRGVSFPGASVSSLSCCIGHVIVGALVRVAFALLLPFPQALFELQGKACAALQ